MKRSEINSLIKDAEKFLKEHSFHLPPFAFWSPEDWTDNREKTKGIRQRRLGWDITDFGSGDFYNTGLLLFTLRNGLGISGSKPYAEKIMIVRPGQVTPMHFHYNKTEDIINRGGGDLIIELYYTDKDETLSGEDVTVRINGVERTFSPGTPIKLTCGDSVTLNPFMYHRFYGDSHCGKVLVGEVSSVNDDNEDNRFLEPVGRFPEIEEDEPVLYPLVFEYN